MENLDLEQANDYKLLLKLGIAAILAGMIFAGFGKVAGVMNTLGNFLIKPGAVVFIGGFTLAGLKADELSTGIRMAALIGAGILASYFF